MDNDTTLFSLLKETWGRGLLFTSIVIMCAAVTFLAFENKAMQLRMEATREAAKNEIRECERECAREKDAIRREQIAAFNAANERQDQIEKRITQIKRKIK